MWCRGVGCSFLLFIQKRGSWSLPRREAELRLFQSFPSVGFVEKKLQKKSALFHYIPGGSPRTSCQGVCSAAAHPQLSSAHGRHLAHAESGPCLVLPARVRFSLNPGQFGCLSTSAFQRGQETCSLAVSLDFFMVILGAAVQRILSISTGNWATSAFLWVRSSQYPVLFAVTLLAPCQSSLLWSP